MHGRSLLHTWGVNWIPIVELVPTHRTLLQAAVPAWIIFTFLLELHRLLFIACQAQPAHLITSYIWTFLQKYKLSTFIDNILKGVKTHQQDYASAQLDVVGRVASTVLVLSAKFLDAENFKESLEQMHAAETGEDEESEGVEGECDFEIMYCNNVWCDYASIQSKLIPIAGQAP